MGDIHQPLHTVAEVDSEFPKGDQGGNAEQVPSRDGVENLHGIWDSVVYSYTGYETLPMDENKWDWYTEQAALIEENNPIDNLQVKP